MSEKKLTRNQLGVRLVELKKLEEQIKAELKEAQEAYLEVCHEEGNFEEMETAFYKIRYQSSSTTKTASIAEVRKQYPTVYEALAYTRENKETLKFIKPKK